MKFSTIAIVASVVAVASAAVDYPFPPEPQCISDCKVETGKKIIPDYTIDPANEAFMKSLAIEMVRGTPDYIRFMSDSGMCMMKCTDAEKQAYTANFKARREWYQKATGTEPTASGAPGTAPTGTDAAAKPTTTNAASSSTAMLTVSSLVAAAAALALF